MKQTSEVTACVVDNGLFTELAARLARDFKRVLYWCPWEAEFPTANDRAVGDGYSEIERIEDPLDLNVVDETDLYIFPDIFHRGMQLILERLGKSVWGSRRGDALETNRTWLRHLQEELALPVPDYTVIRGLANLRSFLKDHGHCFIKTTSRIRGSMETWEHRDFEQSEYKLDELKVKLGRLGNRVVFMVEEPIDCPYETGIDTYCIDGQFPQTPMQGIEIKGKLILCSAQTQSATPKALDDTLSAFSDLLREIRYRNFLSLEFRKDILIDPCCRCPNPGIGVEMEMIENLAEIILAGAKGELVEPKFAYEFGVQAAIFHDDEPELWKQFRLPEEVRQWVKLMENCLVDGLEQIIPRPPHGQKIGWLLGVGDSIQECAEHLQSNAEKLKDFPFDIKLDALPEAIRQVEALEKEGKEFTDQPVPDPDTVLKD